MFNDCYKEYKDLPLKIVNKHFKGFLINYKDDLYSQAYLLLFEAYKNFDKNNGTKFETYAYSYIYYGISKYLDVNLQGHQRRNIKQSNGKFKMEITKPTFISMNAERDTTTSETIDLSFFQGEEDENYSIIDLKLSFREIIKDLEKREKIDKNYRSCGKILETILNNPCAKPNEIKSTLNMHHTTYYRKLQLIRNLIKNKYKEVL